MGPRVQSFVARSLTLRTRPIVPQKRCALAPQQRLASNDSQKNSVSPLPEGAKGPNQEQLPHVSEEQAAMDKVTGETPPDLERGTPVHEMVKDDPEGQKNLPEVMKQELGKPSNGASQKRSFSTSARRKAEATDLVKIENGMIDGMEYPDAGFGHKFPLPDYSTMKKTDNFKKRYDPIVDQFTKSIMQSGKLARAQKNMQDILDVLRASPPPQANIQFPTRTLLTDSSGPHGGSLNREALPLYPVTYLTSVIDSIAPLIKIRQQKGLAGGGASTPIPVPLGLRQRRRAAIQWILDSANNRKEVKLSDRVAREIINIAEGKSSAWEKRANMHKIGTSARSNVRLALMRRR